MKYAVFFMMYLVGVPFMGAMGMMSKRLLGLLLAALIFSPTLGDISNIFFVSMEHYRGPDRGYEVNLTDLIAWGLIIAFMAKSSKNIKWLPYNSIFIFIFGILACISTFVAPERLIASFTLFKLAKIYVLFWCVANCLRADVDPKYICDGIAAIGICVALIVIKQKYINGVYQTPGPFDHQNTVHPFLNQVMPVLLIWGLCDKSFSKIRAAFYVSASFAMVLAVVFTLSRAGMLLAVCCMLGAIGITNIRYRSKRSVVTIFLVLVLIIAGGIKSADSIIDRFVNAPESSGEARDEFNIAAEMMADDKFFGIGLNNYSHVLTVTPKYRAHIAVMGNEEHAGVAHHIYWLTAAEMGYIGVGVFALIILRFMWRAFRYAWASRSLESMILFGVFFGSFALHASGFLEWALRITPVTQMTAISAGLCVAFSDKVARDISARKRLGR